METNISEDRLFTGIQYVILPKKPFELETELIQEVDGISFYAPFFTIKDDVRDGL